MNELLFLSPIFQKKIWGGSKMKNMFEFDCGEQTGECWSISAHQNGMGKVKSAPYEGMDLAALWKKHPELFFNEDGKLGSEFPLLVKIIDAKEDLSVQVHPDDQYAGEHENGSLGKMECWYVLECEEGASIVIGHEAKDHAKMQEMIKKGQWKEFLHEEPIKKGDFFQIDPGCVHAIKGGTIILETQQSSDLTYRIYDYNRLEDGKARSLNLKAGMEVISAPYVSRQLERRQVETADVKIEHLITCSKYSVEKYDIHGCWTHRFRAAFTNLTVISGSGKINDIVIRAGESVIVPYDCGSITLEGEFSAICSWPEYEMTIEETEKRSYQILILDWLDRIKAKAQDDIMGVIAFQDIYEEGDWIKIIVPKENQFYKIRIDDTVDESLVYVTNREILFEIPFGEKKKSYNKKSFSGDRHYLTVRKAEDYEIQTYKNLAKNVMDQHGCHAANYSSCLLQFCRILNSYIYFYIYYSVPCMTARFFRY